MTALLIGENERAAIAALKERAKARVTVVNAHTMELLVNVGDKARAENVDFTIQLPVDFRVTYTLEDQPAGRVEHLSVSVGKRGRAPNAHAMDMILAEFGMRSWRDSDSVWVEEFEPGHQAVNVAQVIRPAPNLS